MPFILYSVKNGVCFICICASPRGTTRTARPVFLSTSVRPNLPYPSFLMFPLPNVQPVTVCTPSPKQCAQWLSPSSTTARSVLAPERATPSRFIAMAPARSPMGIAGHL